VKEGTKKEKEMWSQSDGRRKKKTKRCKNSATKTFKNEEKVISRERWGGRAKRIGNFNFALGRSSSDRR